METSRLLSADLTKRRSHESSHSVRRAVPEENKAFILEFKVYNKRREKTLEDTVKAALAQIEEKQYEQTLLAHGIPKENIRKYGFAFRGAEVLIGEADDGGEK